MSFKITENQVRTRFHYALGKMGMASWVMAIADAFMDSTMGKEEYPFLAPPKPMTKWEGERNIQSLQERVLTIVNEPFETSIGIPGRALRRGRKSIIDRQLQLLGGKYYSNWAKLVTDLLVLNPTTPVDSKALYANDHNESGANQDNLLGFTAASSILTQSEASELMTSAIGAMLGFKDDEDEPTNEDAMNFLIMCSPLQLASIATAIGSPIVSNGVAAVPNAIGSYNGFSIRAHANPRISNTDVFTFRTDGPGAVVIQEEVGEGLGAGISILGTESEHFFKRGEILVGVDASRGVGPGSWQSTVKTVIS